ncbi:hypothetical protein SAMN05216525_15834 [Bradyrhizobium sp. Gha]|nr:hypothetical protein SAMN05216525_15834 [Bradyrhizobium sp. Gha]
MVAQATRDLKMIDFALSCIRRPAPDEFGTVHFKTGVACWMSIMKTSGVVPDSSNRHAMH